jgi:general stress protein 26
MKTDDPAVLDVIKRSMVARIATLSRNGRPSINPLYFVYQNGHIWLGTVDWTLAARNVKADPRVSVLFEVERDPGDHRVLRMRGQASVRTDQKTQRSYNLRVARKYILTFGSMRNSLAHIRLFTLKRRYHAQSAEKGQACIIEVTPEQAEFLNDDQ